MRHLSSDISVEEKEGLVFNQAQGHLHHLFFLWMSTGEKRINRENKEENAESNMKEKPQEALRS